MQQNEGIITAQSAHSVDRTVEILLESMREKGITLFSLVDHSGEAAMVGLKMPPTKLLIFGNPKAGTPVMLSAPSIALDLPLKLLVWQDVDGETRMSYNSADYLRERHNVPPEFLNSLTVAATLAKNASI